MSHVTSGPTLTAAHVTPSGAVSVDWSTGRADELPAVWLRDACRCPECRDPGNDQHLIDVLDVAPGVSVHSAEVSVSGLSVEFGGDGGPHRGLIPIEALLRRHGWGSDIRCCWSGTHADLLAGEARDLADDPDLIHLLESVDRYGIGLVKGVPRESGEVARFAARFGFVRETNYGVVFDVIAEPDPNNLAYTPLGLPLHTDNPYRDPRPTLQLLHCLESSPTGGMSRFADGLLAAELLRASSPDEFEILTGSDIDFRFHDADADLRASGPIIEADNTGRVVGVRVNHRSMEVPGAAVGDIGAFYRSYRTFCRILADPGVAIDVRLAPGELVVFDNRRVLHGRSGYDPRERRHLQGCYADIDAVRSAVRRAEATDGEGRP